MAGPRGTKVIQNGTPGHSDVKWGITEKIITITALSFLGWGAITLHNLSGAVDVLVRVQTDHVNSAERHESLQQKTAREEAIAEKAAASAILKHMVDRHASTTKEDQ